MMHLLRIDFLLTLNKVEIKLFDAELILDTIPFLMMLIIKVARQSFYPISTTIIDCLKPIYVE